MKVVECMKSCLNRWRVSGGISRRLCTIKYYIPRKYSNFRVCQKTLCNVFKTSPCRLQILQDKIQFKKPLIDKCGLHSNRSNKLSDQTFLNNTILSSFPIQENHYSNKCEKDVECFLLKHPEVKCSQHYYWDIINTEFKLRFGIPRSDTCVYCGHLYMQVKLLITKMSLKESE